MRLAFLGTPDFAVRALEAIVAAGHEVVCAYSQPPAPRGRGQDLKPSPVQAFADVFCERDEVRSAEDEVVFGDANVEGGGHRGNAEWGIWNGE